MPRCTRKARPAARRKPAPAPCVHHHAANGRTNIGSKAHSNARNAHSGCLAPVGKTRHGNGLQKRQQHARRNRLHHATCQQHGKARRAPCDKRTCRKHANGQAHQRFQAKAPHEKRRKRHHGAQREHVRRGKPLPHARWKGKIGAYRHHHGIKARLGKVAQCRTKHHHGKHCIRPRFSALHEHERTSTLKSSAPQRRRKATQRLCGYGGGSRTVRQKSAIQKRRPRKRSPKILRHAARSFTLITAK